MTSVAGFLRDMVCAFSRGDFEVLVERVKTPTTVYLGARALVIEDAEALTMALTVFRDNLIKQGYQRSESLVEDVAPRGEAAVQVRLNCVHWSAAGRELDRSCGLHFCSYSAEAGWTILLTEYEKTPEPELISGLPLD